MCVCLGVCLVGLCESLLRITRDRCQERGEGVECKLMKGGETGLFLLGPCDAFAISSCVCCRCVYAPMGAGQSAPHGQGGVVPVDVLRKHWRSHASHDKISRVCVLPFLAAVAREAGCDETESELIAIIASCAEGAGPLLGSTSARLSQTVAQGETRSCGTILWCLLHV